MRTSLEGSSGCSRAEEPGVEVTHLVNVTMENSSDNLYMSTFTNCNTNMKTGEQNSENNPLKNIGADSSDQYFTFKLLLLKNKSYVWYSV